MATVGQEITAALESFRMNSLALDQLLTGHNGTVAADLVRRAIQVEGAAKGNATGRPGPNVKTGRLRGSITWRLDEDVRGLYADVGTAVNYAVYLELGTSKMPAYPFLVPALDAAY